MPPARASSVRSAVRWAEEPRVCTAARPAGDELLPVLPGAVIPAQGGKPKRTCRRYLDYPAEVYDEIQIASDQRVGTKVAVEEHHHDLMRCKVAGILALMEGRTDVSIEDWSIATTMVSLIPPPCRITCTNTGV